jgi:hypothetical protein
MPIADAASINSTGVQISSTNLNTLKLSEDNQIMSIGPGPRWGDVWEHLDGSNLTVVGGRLPPVGVPGLLLGGGISYFSNAHGLASSNGKINAYEVCISSLLCMDMADDMQCVLADGKIVEATKSGKYADLYWALLGGASNYCLVTRFDLRTFYAKTPIRAEASYIASNTTKDAYLDALLTMTLEGDIDTAAAVIPVARWGPNYTVPSYEASLLYNGTTAPTSGPFAAFYDNSALKAEGNSSKLQPLSFASYSQVFRPAFQPGGGGYGFRQKFRVVPIKADREAMDIVHDTWLSALKESNVANRVPGFFAGLAYNCVTKTFAQQSQGMPQNVEPIPQLWVEEAMSWSNAADDAEVEALVSNFNAEIEKQLEAKNLAVRYIYLNDADKGQKAFESYGVENVLKLKAIREKYDPRKVFTNLMPGGFKIDRAKVEGY